MEAGEFMIYILIFLFLFLFIIYLYYQTTDIEINEIFLKSLKIKNNIRILHLSDLHFKREGKKEKELIEIFQEKEFDLLVLTGDFLKEKSKYYAPFAEFFKKLKYKCPAYAVTGNHDYTLNINKLHKILKEAGIKLLLNQGETIRIKDNIINIIGTEDPAAGYDNLETALKNINIGTGFNLLLSHSYHILKSISQKNKFDLLLTGHTHSGQFYFGEKITKVMHGYKYLKGEFLIKDLKMYVNRGIGTTIIPFRLFARPEVTIYEIEKNKL